MWELYGTQTTHTVIISISCQGSDMELYEIHGIPIEKGERLHGIAMGPTHTITISYPMGDIWNFTKYVAFPQQKRTESTTVVCMGFIWMTVADTTST